MIVVIQCAAGKQPDAGRMRTANGDLVEFVADPDNAPPSPPVVYARPDDLAGERTWRELLSDYNREPGDNSLGLLPAYQLYENSAYCGLVDRFGITNVFILSAGWGLLSSEFLTPHYDITFTTAAAAWKRRRKGQHYNDFRMLPDSVTEDIVFIGGKDYLPLFCALTNGIRAQKTVFYNLKDRPHVPGYAFEKFETSRRTNWHYECAAALIAGTIGV